jgi:hypothetical protein
MKLFIAFALCLFCTCAARAQESRADHAPPAVSIIKFKWSREIQPFRQYRDLTAGASARNYPDGIFAAGNPYPSTTGSRPYTVPSPFPPSGRFSYIYIYSTKIMNSSAKAIKAVAWDYVLSNPGNNEELKRHKFYSYEKIGAYEKVTLRGNSSAPPSNVVTLEGLGKDEHAPYEEHVELRCVFYADGTTWKNAAASELECVSLKERERMNRRMNRQRF